MCFIKCLNITTLNYHVKLYMQTFRFDIQFVLKNGGSPNSKGRFTADETDWIIICYNQESNPESWP